MWKIDEGDLLTLRAVAGNFELSVLSGAHLSPVISQKEKMSLGNEFTNFFEVLSGQLKSRV